MTAVEPILESASKIPKHPRLFVIVAAVSDISCAQRKNYAYMQAVVFCFDWFRLN
jgi:hypothetical protein